MTAEGQSLRTALVERAGEIYREGSMVNISDRERDAFQAASAADGSQGDVASPAWSLAVTTPSPNIQHRPSQSSQRAFQKNPKVFIVHGHDHGMRDAVALFVSKIGLEPVILAEQVNGGRTIIEKFEKNADVGYAIVLLSPDDQFQGSGRARQNVVLEWGYFIGRLGRGHVCALKKGNVEIPSDILGVVWQDFDMGGGWKQQLAKELAEAGYSIDSARALWS
jgi:predicted nucleotide-binding protein